MINTLCKPIKIIISDIDGVMTPGSINYSSDDEIKSFDVQDGAGIKYLQRAGIEVAVITGRESKALSRRCHELGITTLIQGAKDKLKPYNDILKEKGLTPAEVCYIGDDFPDIPPLRAAGFSVAPANALREVKLYCDYITSLAGGAGAYRELVMLLIKSQGKWNDIYARYR